MATKKAAPKAKKTERPTTLNMNAKLADPTQIIKDYDKLIGDLAKMELSQRQKSKPYRIYFVHRQRAEVMKMNFVKSLR